MRLARWAPAAALIALLVTDAGPRFSTSLLAQIPVVDGNRFAGLKWTFVRIKYGSYESEGASRLAYWDEPWAIDAPAADRNDMAITLAPFVDATVLVVAAESGAANEPLMLRDEIEAVGGKIAGVVVNRSTYNPPAFLKRLTG